MAEGPVSPAVQIRALLEEARAQAMPFDVAWDWMWPKVRWPHDTVHRLEWKAVLGDREAAERVGMSSWQINRQRDAWERSYTREPVTDREAPLLRLLAAA